MSPAGVRRFRWVGGIVWIALGLALIAFALRLLGGLEPSSSLFELWIGGGCLAIGIAVISVWRLGKWLGILGGMVVGLYAIALVLLGTEDVGGLGVSLPAGILLAIFSIWNFVAAGLRSEAA